MANRSTKSDGVQSDTSLHSTGNQHAVDPGKQHQGNHVNGYFLSTEIGPLAMVESSEYQ